MSSTFSGTNPRLWAIQEVSGRTPRVFDWPKDKDGHQAKVSEIYGVNTFNSRVMK
jgi:hypothetical protein